MSELAQSLFYFTSVVPRQVNTVQFNMQLNIEIECNTTTPQLADKIYII